MSRVPKVHLCRKTKSSGVKSKFHYMIWYDVDGKQHRKSTGKTREDVAEIERCKLQKELKMKADGHDVEELDRLQNMSFQEVMADFLEHVKLYKKLATYSDYKRSLDYFVDDCSPAKITSVTRRMLKKFTDKRIQKVGSITVDKYLRVVRALMNFAVEYDYIDGGRIPKVKLFNENDPDPVAIPRTDLDKIIKALQSSKAKNRLLSNDWWEMLVRLLHYSGARRNEALLLQWSDVDLANRVVRFRKETSKRNRRHAIRLSPDIGERLHSWKAKCKPKTEDELVLPREFTIRTVSEEWLAIRKDLKLEAVTFKALRSTSATELAADYPLSVVQQHLGHTNPAITAKYYINGGSAQRQAADSHKPL